MNNEEMPGGETARLESLESEDNRTVARLEAVRDALAQVAAENPDEDSFEKALLGDVESALDEARELAAANAAKFVLVQDVNTILSAPPEGLRDWCREIMSRLSSAGAGD